MPAASQLELARDPDFGAAHRLFSNQRSETDPQLFEIPAGYTAMPSFGFGKGKPGLGGALKGALSNFGGR